MKIALLCSTVRSVCFLLLACAFPSLRADEKTNPFALLNTSHALSAAADITPEKYPNCDTVTVDEKNVQVYKKDGTGVNQDEEFVKILTEKGKKDRRTIALHYRLPYSTVEIPLVEIIKPNGSVQKVNVAANAKESIDSGEMAANIYDPSAKVLEVNIPSLEVGDLIHDVSRTITSRAIVPGEFADGNVFEGTGAIRHLVYEVHSPPDKPLRHIVCRDEIPGTLKKTTQTGENGTVIHRWEVSQVPRMFPEPKMPPSEDVLQRVQVSTTQTWQDISKWYWELSRPHLEALTPELKKKVADLTRDTHDDLGKIQTLFYYVSQNIRYMGVTPEKDRPGFEPHDVCLTFDKKYGVCRDKATLLVAMLREAGFKAWPALVSVGSRKDPEVPDAGFNHAIAAVELKDGEYTLMDPTDEHARDLFPSYDGNQSYLVAKPGGETIHTSPVVPPDQNMIRIRTTGTLEPSGELRANSEFLFDGINDDAYRGAFSQMRPDDRRRFFESRLQAAVPGAKLTSLKLTPENILDVTEKLRGEIEFSATGMTATGNGKAVVTLPWLGTHLGVVNSITRDADLDRRKYPLQTWVTCGLNETISLKLGKGFSGVVSLPKFQPLGDESLSYDQEVKTGNDGTIECKRDLKLKTVDYSPAQYLVMKKALKALASDSRKAPILTVHTVPTTADTTKESTGTPRVESNAKVLDVRRTLDVTDAHTALYRTSYTKRILTYAGKIQESEIKLEFNPSCEEVKFLKGVVTSTKGERREVSPGEIHVLDTESGASAKRYTGGKILVANLPSVEVGSTIEVEYERLIKGKPFISGIEFFQLRDELQKKTFELTAPEQLKIGKLLSGGALSPAEYKTNENGTQHLFWNAEDRKALPEEKDLPPNWLFWPSVTFYLGDFETYLKELQQVFLNRSESSAHVAKIARKIVAESKSRLDTLRAIRDYVATNIREAGPSFIQLPLHELSQADVTLSEGYGHQADRAILLYAMLAAAGFQPELVLASDLPAIEKISKIAVTFPLPDDFSTLLLKVSLDGETYYLNDTDQFAELGTTAHDNRLAIELSTRKYGVIHAARDDNDRTETRYNLGIDDNGRLQMDVSRYFYGKEYNDRSRFYAELRPEERKRHYQKLVTEVAQGAHQVGELTTRFDIYPGTEHFSVLIDNFAVVDETNCYFSLPFTPSFLRLPGDETRTLPLLISRQNRTTLKAEITLPPGYPEIVISPVSKKFSAPSGAGGVEITANSSSGSFHLKEELEIIPAVVAPEEYPALRALESQLAKTSSSLFLLKKKNASDAAR